MLANLLGGLFTMDHEMKGNKAADFKLERYKYILQQLHSLNENTHKYLTLFQSLTTAVIGGAALIFVSWKQLQIDAGTARVGVIAMLWLLVILAVFVVFSILSNVLSWYDYRKEEVKILDEEVESGFREPPRWKNFYRWNETYLMIFIIFVIVAIFAFVYSRVLPLIQ